MVPVIFNRSQDLFSAVSRQLSKPVVTHSPDTNSLNTQPVAEMTTSSPGYTYNAGQLQAMYFGSRAPQNIKVVTDALSMEVKEIPSSRDAYDPEGFDALNQASKRGQYFNISAESGKKARQ